MYFFDDGELEIALVTYNRPLCVQEWLKNNLKDIINRNIKLTIYDSSDTEETKRVVENANNKTINYCKLDSNVTIGEKPIIALQRSTSKYVWICVDRRCANFQDLDKYVFPKIKEAKFETLLMPELQEKAVIAKEYNNMSEFINDGLWTMTHLGDIIYRKNIFDIFWSDNNWTKIMQNKEYMCSFGFLAYHLNALAINGHYAYIHSVRLNYSKEKTRFSWQKHMFKYLIDDFIEIINDLPEAFLDKDVCISIIINEMRRWVLSAPHKVLYGLRVEADLADVYDTFEKKGYWKYFSEVKSEIVYYAKESISSIRKQRLFIEQDECLDSEIGETLARFFSLKDVGKNKIYVYGAGYSGQLVYEYLQEERMQIAGFIDINANEIKTKNGCKVFCLDEVNVDDAYVIISLKRFIPEIKDTLSLRGIEEDRQFYVCERVVELD